MRKDIQFLGTVVSRFTLQDLTASVASYIENNCLRAIISNHNLHSIFVFHRDPVMREFYEASDICHFDGMGAVWIARLLGNRVNGTNRITYVDWIWSVMERASKSGWKIYFVGGRPGVAERAGKVFQTRFGAIQFSGRDGFFNAVAGSADNLAVLKQIREYQPNLLIVGMGMPRQERWILENLEQIEANVILQAGACMDYVAGVVPTPPRWMGRAGLEWLYRFAFEPRRLAIRYLVEPWFVAWWVVMALLRGEHSWRVR